MESPMSAFSTISQAHPGQFAEFVQLLLQFINTYFTSHAMQPITDIVTLQDGVSLIQLVGLIADTFVPLSKYNLNPVSRSQSVNNVSLCLDLMRDCLGVDQYLLDDIQIHQIVDGNIQAISKLLFYLQETINYYS